jgi:SAM-dependent methyltransferase
VAEGPNPYERPEFVARYVRSRPRPPTELLTLLSQLCGKDLPDLVVDLGSGTGYSTLAWSRKAARVVGIESNPVMLRQARRAPHVEYRLTSADRTGLASGTADVVTCSQSFHWMDPKTTIPEIARILRPGGVFAAYDYALPPLIDPQLDPPFRALMRWAHLPTQPEEKARHPTRLARSGRFRWVGKVSLHRSDVGDLQRALDLPLSIAHIAARLDGGAESSEKVWQRFRTAAERAFGTGRRRFWWTYDVNLAVK